MSWIIPCGFLVIFIFWFITTLKFRMKNLPPGPFPLPIVGNIAQLMLIDKEFPFVAFTSLAKTFGGVMTVRLGIVNSVVISGYEDVKATLNSDDWLGRMNEPWQHDRTFGKSLGLIFSDVAFWTETRKMTMRALRQYGFGTKSSMETLIVEDLQDFCQHLQKTIDKNKGIVEMRGIFHPAVFNAVWALLAGTRFALDDPSMLRILNLVDNFFRTGRVSGGLLGAFPFLAQWAPTLVGVDKQHVINVEIQEFLRSVIEDFRASEKFKEEPDNFIDWYLKCLEENKEENYRGELYSDENLISIIYDMLIAGSETSASALNYSMMYMSLYPDIQKRVQEEIDGIIGREKWPSLEDQPKLPYTQAVIFEVYRKVVVLPLAPRKLHKDTVYGGYLIPKGTNAIINYWSVCQDEGLWPNPKEFRPDRFLDSEGKLNNNGDKLFTFSTGKRNCLGELTGKTTVFIFFVGLMQRFNLSINKYAPYPDTKPNIGFTNSPKDYSLQIQPRS